MKNCYLCGSLDQITKDHIPPKGFFVPPLPDNLITVPCCKSCHDRFKLDDEAFRAFAASHQGISEQGMWIYREKVLGSTLRRSPKLAQCILNSMAKVEVEIDGTRQVLSLLHFPRGRGDSFLVRIAKGMLATYYPSISRNALHYKVGDFEPNQELIDYIDENFSHDQRGNGAFRFWHTVMLDQSVKGLWFFVFYDKVGFCVSHSMDEM